MIPHCAEHLTPRFCGHCGMCSHLEDVVYLSFEHPGPAPVIVPAPPEPPPQDAPIP